jgi:TonB family protein
MIEVVDPYGSVELKKSYNRNLLIGMGISLLLHGLVIGFYVISGQKEAPPRDLTLAMMPDPRKPDTAWYTIMGDPNPAKKKPGPDGGGEPDADAPIGRTQKGDKNAVPDHTRDHVDKTRSVDYKNPGNVKPALKDPKPPSLAGDTRDTSKNVGITGTRGQSPNGTADKPGRGSGGVGVGFASGMGGRGWVVKPRASYPAGLNSEGVVQLRFTVLPNGMITNIVPVKRADAALVRAAISGLQRAKARPLPSDAPQVAQVATIPFSFELP